MRMFTEVGRRVEPHGTAVGKAIMATMPIDEAREILKRSGMPGHTDTTITDPDEFAAQLAWSPSTATPSTRASRRPAYAASPSRYPTCRPDSPFQSPAPPAA